MSGLKIKSACKYLGFLILWFYLMYILNRERMVTIINQSLPPTEAGLLAAMLIGDKSGLSKDFLDQLKLSGLIHLTVVSGSNVTLLGKSIVENLAGWWGRKKVIVGTLLLIWLYAVEVGWEPPVIRAVLLLSIYYWAQLLGRKFNATRALILVAGMMLLSSPAMVISASFWLSIVAFLGVVTYRWKGSLGQTVWVTIWITPILALVFGQISWLSPITNLLVVMTVEVLTVVGGLGVAVGGLIPWAGKIILMGVGPILDYFMKVAEVGGGSYASLKINFNWLMAAGWYAVLGYGLLRMKRNET